MRLSRWERGATAGRRSNAACPRACRRVSLPPALALPRGATVEAAYLGHAVQHARSSRAASSGPAAAVGRLLVVPRSVAQELRELELVHPTKAASASEEHPQPAAVLLNNVLPLSATTQLVPPPPPIAASPDAPTLLLEGPSEDEDARFDFAQMRDHLAALAAYYEGNSAHPQLLEQALEAAVDIKTIVTLAVNTKYSGLRTLQAKVVQAGAVTPLIALAQQGHAIAFEALQILCYRHNVTCKQIGAGGIVEHIALTLSTTHDLELQCAMCFLLTGLVAFCEATHERVISAGLVPQLVALCRARTSVTNVQVGVRESTLQTRAAAVLRNLSHNTKNHGLLINAGAVDALVDVMRMEKDPASRINAAIAVACLVGHEEGNPKLQLSEDLVVEMLKVLDTACAGSMQYGTFWTVWKLCQGLASLTVNDRNKELITAHDGVAILRRVLAGRHHNNEAAHRFALSALWNLAFYEAGRQAIMATPGLVDAIRTTLLTTESARTKEVAKGALWTLGLEQDIRSLQEGRSSPHTSSSSSTAEVQAGEEGGEGDADVAPPGEHVPHVMLSYEWGCQQSVMLIKTELQKAGYATWMDIDKMSGSTLEAMARAVEESAVVLVCVSKRYKESQACRTEAEYAFQQRKKIIPILMERDYKPSGWLGALMGTRLYFSLHDPRQIHNKMPGLIKELGDDGRLVCPVVPGGGSGKAGANALNTMMDRPEAWTHADVEEWLRRIRCGEYTKSFRDKDMDGTALSGLFRMGHDASFLHQVLTSELGVKTLGQRLRMVEELHRLFS